MNRLSKLLSLLSLFFLTLFAEANAAVNTTLAVEHVQNKASLFYQVLIAALVLIIVYIIAHWILTFYKAYKEGRR